MVFREEEESAEEGINTGKDGTQGKYSSSVDWRNSGYVTSVSQAAECWTSQSYQYPMLKILATPQSQSAE